MVESGLLCSIRIDQVSVISQTDPNRATRIHTHTQNWWQGIGSHEVGGQVPRSIVAKWETRKCPSLILLHVWRAETQESWWQTCQAQSRQAEGSRRMESSFLQWDSEGWKTAVPSHYNQFFSQLEGVCLPREGSRHYGACRMEYEPYPQAACQTHPEEQLAKCLTTLWPVKWTGKRNHQFALHGVE